MINLLEAAIEIQSFCETKKKPFCFIGGIAVLQWGEIRVTNDIDIALLCGYGNEVGLINLLLKQFSSRIQDAANFALINRVLLLSSKDGVPLDITLTGLDFESQMIERSSKHSFVAGYNINICSPEDLIVMKAFANRIKDWGDIESIVLKQRGKLQVKMIYENLAPLVKLKEDPSIIQRLKTFLPN
jgi:hypothetical protein